MNESIEYDLFKESLQSLNEEIQFDEDGEEGAFYEGGRQGRTGLFFRGQHIGNVDRGFITEWEKVENFYEKVTDRITPQEALANPNDEMVTTHQDLFHTKGDVFEQQCFLDANKKLGKRLEGEIRFGTGQSIARRMDVGYKNKTTGEIENIPGVLVYIYVKDRMVKTTISRIGWRQTFEHLLALGIEGVTRETIEELFEVDITNKKPSDGPTIEKMARGEI